MTRRRGGGSVIPERLLARLWQERAARAGLLRAANGRLFRVLYPGRRGTSAGPDFRDALLHQEGLGLVCGDVEIHVREEDWQAHGHSHDPRYNSVALHVVYQAHSSFTQLPNGARAPVMSIKSLLERPASSSPDACLWGLLESRGFPRPETEAQLASSLDRAGDQRFREKSQAFSAFMEEESPEQVLYAAIMEGLGYSQNRAPFLELARRRPYHILRRAALGHPPSRRAALLTGMLRQEAGFGSTYDNAGAVPVRRGRPMEGARWHLFRVRPGNHPRRRIEGAAVLLARHLEEGLVEGLTGLVLKGVGGLERGLTVEAAGQREPALIGGGRARDLAVNVALPFTHAFACSRGTPELAWAATSLYHGYPKLEENEITREMGRLLLSPDTGHLVSGARRQQGLMHLQRLLAGGSSR